MSFKILKLKLLSLINITYAIRIINIIKAKKNKKLKINSFFYFSKNFPISFKFFWTFFVNSVVKNIQKIFYRIKWYKKNNYLFIYWMLLYYCFKSSLNVKQLKKPILKKKQSLKKKNLFLIQQNKINFKNSKMFYKKFFWIFLNFSYFGSQVKSCKLYKKSIIRLLRTNVKKINKGPSFNILNQFEINFFNVQNYNVKLFFKKILGFWKGNFLIFKKKYYIYFFKKYYALFVYFWQINFIYALQFIKPKKFFKNSQFFIQAVLVIFDKYIYRSKYLQFKKIETYQFYLKNNVNFIFLYTKMKKTSSILLYKFKLIYSLFYKKHKIIKNKKKKKFNFKFFDLNSASKINFKFIKKPITNNSPVVYNWVNNNKNVNFMFVLKYFYNFIHLIYQNTLYIKYANYKSWLVYLYFFLIKYKKILFQKKKFKIKFKQWNRRFLVFIKKVSIKISYKLRFFMKILFYLSKFAEVNFYNFFLLIGFKYLTYIQNLEAWFLDVQSPLKWFWVKKKIRFYLFNSNYKQFIKKYKLSYLAEGVSKGIKNKISLVIIKKQFLVFFSSLWENDDFLYNIIYRPFRVGIFFREIYISENKYWKTAKFFFNKYFFCKIAIRALLVKHKLKFFWGLFIPKQKIKKLKLFINKLKSPTKKVLKKKITVRDLNIIYKGLYKLKKKNLFINLLFFIKKKLKNKKLWKQSRIKNNIVKKVFNSLKYKSWIFKKFWSYFNFSILKKKKRNKNIFSFISFRNNIIMKKFYYLKKNKFINFAINRFLFLSKNVYKKYLLLTNYNSLSTFLYFKKVLLLKYLLKKKQLKIKPFFKLNFKFFKEIKYVMPQKTVNMKFKYFKIFLFPKNVTVNINKQFFLFKFIFFWVVQVLKKYFIFLMNSYKVLSSVKKFNEESSIFFFKFVLNKTNILDLKNFRSNLKIKQIKKNIIYLIVLQKFLNILFLSFKFSLFMLYAIKKWYNVQIFNFYKLILGTSKKKNIYLIPCFIKIYNMFIIKFFIFQKLFFIKNSKILSPIFIFSYIYLQYFIYFYIKLYMYKKYRFLKKKKKN